MQKLLDSQKNVINAMNTKGGHFEECCKVKVVVHMTSGILQMLRIHLQ